MYEKKNFETDGITTLPDIFKSENYFSFSFEIYVITYSTAVIGYVPMIYMILKLV